jgi:hypothetical protein
MIHRSKEKSEGASRRDSRCRHHRISRCKEHVTVTAWNDPCEMIVLPLATGSSVTHIART